MDADRARSAAYARIVRRNRVVSVLRFVLPAAGVAVVAMLGLRGFLGTALPQFEFAGISVDRESLTVEAPIFSGIGADGSVYAVSAATARSLFGDPDRLDLANPSLRLTQLDGIVFNATSAAAHMDLATQHVTVDGAMAVESTSGLVGTVWKSTMDVAREQLVATGGADLAFGEDATIKAETMRYDGEKRLWFFERATVTLTELPGADAPVESAADDAGVEPVEDEE